MSNVSSMSRLAPGKENMLVLGRMMKESGTYLDDMASKTPHNGEESALASRDLSEIINIGLRVGKKKIAFTGFYKMAEKPTAAIMRNFFQAWLCRLFTKVFQSYWKTTAKSLCVATGHVQ